MELLTYIKTAWNFVKSFFNSKSHKSQTKLIDSSQIKNAPFIGNSTDNINLKDIQGENIMTIGHITHNTYRMGEQEALDYINKVIGKDISRLREENSGFKETIKIIENNYSMLIETLSRVVQLNIDTIDKNKQYQPDIQYTINNALILGTRKGDRINLEILSKLVVEKMRFNSDEIFDVVVDSSLKAITELNQKQIVFLTFIFCIQDVKIHNINEEGFTNYFKNLEKIINISDFSFSNIGYLQSNGILQFNSIGIDIYNRFKNNYDFLPDNESDLRGEKYKEFKNLLELYKKLTASRVALLPTGKLIAVISAEKILNQTLDYKNWIN